MWIVKVKRHETKTKTKTETLSALPAARHFRPAPLARPVVSPSGAGAAVASETANMTTAATDLQEKIYARLRKLEDQACRIQLMRDRNETEWQKAFEKARSTPGWKAQCAKTGAVENYNYGDVIC